MLKSLSYSVTFPTTGRSFQNQIEFEPGLTGITGRNEAGKTLVIEMIRYALFGKAALRGLASDYKDLAVTLEFETNGKSVRIERAKKETMVVGGQAVAVGADAINREVPKLLGYGLNVFDITQAAMQGDLGALTDMKPTARRAMVDQLIGLDVLEGIEKDCKAEAKTHTTVAAHLAISAAPPIEPVKPDDYEPSADLEVKLNEVRVHEQERQQLLHVKEPVKPIEPVNPNVGEVEELEQAQAQRNEALQRKARLEGQLAGMPLPQFSREDLEKALVYQTYQQEVAKRGPEPDVTVELLREMEKALDVQQRAGDEVSCPKCDHHFHLGIAPTDEKWLGHVVPLTRAQITTEFRRHELWAEPLTEVAEFVIPNLQQEIHAHANADTRGNLAVELEALSVPVDRGDDLRAARAYRESLAVYGERAARYSAELHDWENAQTRLGTLADRTGELADLQRRIGDARSFENALGRYHDAQRQYDELCARATAARETAEGFDRGATALKAARVKVKQELAPSLSKAASALITAMTFGERRHVDVDHDFNIIVDGQPLQTLSGSGKSVVNLALRLGLGQVLTSKVLPIFMGDEIDKDMDSERAASTHETFQNLREYLSQIIIVTHKGIEADQVIAL